MSEAKKKASPKDSLRLLARGFREAHRLSPGILFFQVVFATISALPPFVNIIFPALIIRELMGGKDIKRLVTFVLLALAIDLGLHVINIFLDLHMDKLSNKCFFLTDMKISDVLLHTDFERLEDPRFHEKYHKYQESRDGRGSQVLHLVWWLHAMIKGIVGVVGAIILIFPLLRMSLRKGAGDSFIESPLFAVTLLVFVAVAVVIVLLLSKKMNGNWYRLHDERMAVDRLRNFYSKLTTDYKTGKEIRIYHEQALIEHDATQEIWKKGVEIEKKLADSSGKSSSFVAIIGAVLGCGVYLFIGLKALYGLFSISSLVMYMGSFMQVIQGISDLASATGQLSEVLPRLRYYFDLIDLPPLKEQAGTRKVETEPEHPYELEFRNVSFHYPGTENYALKDFSICLRAGGKMAVVGMNGSGKTTFIKLLCRLYDPQEGEILLNGVNIREYSEEEYQKLFSVVFQDFNLFSFTVGQNVASGESYDALRAMDCLEEAGIAERVKAMPKQLDTSVYKDFDDTGVEISGGEAQKLALARALYKNAPFVILDEPTAALDPIAEFDIYARFNQIIRNRTAIYISHRLSSCRFCDDIAVFHEGRMIQRGSHEELVRDESGKYYELWHAQAQYYDKKTRESLHVS